MRKRIIQSLLGVCLGAASANADVSEMIFYPEADFSAGIVHFSYQGSEIKNYGFVFDKGVDVNRILYARPVNHIIETLESGLIKLSFPDTNNYTYLQKFSRNDFVISEEKGNVNILLSGGDCMSAPECVTDENLLTVAIPGGYRLTNYKGLDHNLKELHNPQWQIKGNTITLIARKVKGASIVLQLEKSSVTQAKGAGSEAPKEPEARSLILRNDRLFEKGLVQLSLQGKKELQGFARAMKRSPDKKVAVEGHTDNVPLQRLKAVYGTNQNLSEARAKSVAGYLRGEGIAVYEVTGYGEARPIASNETEEGRLQNGRIELVVTPKEPSQTPAPSPL